MARQPQVVTVDWKVHTPALLREILCNSGAQALEKPLQIFGLLLHDVAKRAAEINDPALNILMLRLCMYDAGDPEKHSSLEINAAMRAQQERMRAS